MTYYFALLVLVSLLFALLLWYQRESRRTRQTALTLLHELDDTYDAYMHQRLNLAFLQEKDWQDERTTLIDEGLEVIKPTLDALASLISSSRYQGMKLPLDSPVFKNVAALAEANVNQRNPHLRFEELKTRFYAAFRDAARADLSQRWLAFQTGETLQP